MEAFRGTNERCRRSPSLRSAVRPTQCHSRPGSWVTMRRIVAVLALASVPLLGACGSGTQHVTTDCGPHASCGVSTTTSSVRPSPHRFEIRPVLAATAAPCGNTQTPSRGSSGLAACYTLGPTGVNGNDVVSVSVSEQPQDGVGLNISLTSGGLTRFNGLARQGYARPEPQDEVAFVVVGQVVTVPRFNTRTFTSSGIRVTGNFTKADADRIAAAICELPPGARARPGVCGTNGGRYFDATPTTRAQSR